MADFSHRVLFYGDDEEYFKGTVPFLRASLEAGEPSLVAVRPSRGELLRGELGEDAGEVEFIDMEVLGRNPARIIPVWRDFVERSAPGVAARGIGEPAWPGRDAAELDECRRHEQLLNLAFGHGHELMLLCPYDAGGLDDEVLEAAYESHSHTNGHLDRCAPFGGTLEPPPPDATVLAFGRDDLPAVRRLIARETAAWLSAERRSDLVVAVSELAANSVLHGGGCGTVRIWREAGVPTVEVRDRGTIASPLAGRLRPSLEQEGGRGLWMVNQLCDLAQIRTGPDGSVVRLRMNVGGPGRLGGGAGEAVAEARQVEHASYRG